MVWLRRLFFRNRLLLLFILNPKRMRVIHFGSANATGVRLNIIQQHQRTFTYTEEIEWPKKVILRFDEIATMNKRIISIE